MGVWPISECRKEHGAGVCCIQPSMHNEFVLCTGCYDEHIRLWDTRNPSRPVITAKACSLTLEYGVQIMPALL